MSNRRRFIKHTSLAIGSISVSGLLSCKPKDHKTKRVEKAQVNEEKEIKISLAQWSLNRAFFAKELDPINFAEIASTTYDIHAIEYVNQFYVDQVNDEKFWQDLRRRADDHNVGSLLIMVDDEGDLGNLDKNLRKEAVNNHFKWVNAAKLLGCHSIRVNAFGEGTKEEVRSALLDGMSKLSVHAAKEDINVIIENHGLYSSDAKWIASIIEEVNMPNFGTLPDFGNWCTNEKWGSTQNNKCTEVYDRYQGVSEFLPYAKGVSAKSYDFNVEGQDTIIDYKKMLALVKNSDYNGYIGIEYEGELLSEPEGIKATKNLLEKIWAEV